MLQHSAVAEMTIKKGSDLFVYPYPMPSFETLVIDHREIYEECRSNYGKPIDLAIRSTYNPRTKKSFGFAPSFIPLAINYRKDLWDSVGVSPDTWDDIRIGGSKIKQKHRSPVWIYLGGRILFAPQQQSIMSAFGARIQDEEGKVILDSSETVEAVRFVKALYEEAMSEQTISWEDVHCDFHDEFLLSGTTSLLMTSNAPPRTAEIADPEMSKKIQLGAAPKGPVRRMGHCHVPVYFIWEFADNIEGAKKFLVDYVGNFREAFLAGRYRDYPCFPATVPDLKKLLANDPRAHPPDKYNVLGDALDWTTNLGYPGHTNAAIEETITKRVISKMFSRAASGKTRPRDAVKEADAEAKRIFSAWRETGKV